MYQFLQISQVYHNLHQSCYLKLQTTVNTTTLGSNIGNNTYLPIQIGSSLDQMHTPHQIVGTASDITVNVTQNIKQKIKKGEYV